MKIKVVLIFILWIHSFTALTQVNLIPNGGFDNEECLDFDTTFFFHLSFWHLEKWLPNYYYNVVYDSTLHIVVDYDFNNHELYQYQSPDFFHPCLSEFLNRNSLTNNIFGYQMPFSGLGYAGLGIFIGEPYVREFMRIELSDTLKKGQGYCFRMRYALADKSNRVASHLGAVFSVDSFHLAYNSVEISEKPQIYADYIMCEDLDTSSWRVLEGNFVAEGKEQWLTIGWFHHLNQIYWKKMLFPEQIADSIMAYYYIDALELIECPQYGVPDYEIIPPNVISPNGDGLNDAFYIHPYLPQPSSLIIYNRWGAEVFRSANYDQTWQGATTDGKPVAEGTYFYVLQLPSGTVKKGTVSVFR